MEEVQGKEKKKKKKEAGSEADYLRFRSSIGPLKDANEDRITASIHA